MTVPFPLHKAPQGLLELFRLRTLGAAPPMFGDVVTPVIDVGEFYAAANKLCSSSAPAVGAISPPLIETFDISAAIRLHAVGAQLLIGAAPATDISLDVRVQIGAVSCVLASQFFAQAPAAGRISVGTIVPAWVLLPQQALTLIAVASGTAAGADHSLSISTVIDNITQNAP